MNMKRWMENYFAKVPILGYIVVAFLKWFLIIAPTLALVFAGLWLMGVYPEMESWLDLGYNSPLVWVPLMVFAALALLSFFMGALLYFHKYKRKNKKSDFRKALLEAYADAGTN